MTGATRDDSVVSELAERVLPIVLVGGPLDGQWYHRDDFATRQLAARRMAQVHRRRPTDPASVALGYAPTAKLIRHRTNPASRAVAWVWTGPANTHTLHDLARLDAEAAAAEAAGGQTAVA